MFNGKKTYIVAIGAALTAIGGFMTGQINLVELIAGLFGATGLGTLRAGIASDVKKK